MIRKDWCPVHSWTEHEVSDDCFCNDLDDAGYTFQDEYGDCDYCETIKPICIACQEEE